MLSPEGEGRALGIVAQDSGEKCGLVVILHHSRFSRFQPFGPAPEYQLAMRGWLVPNRRTLWHCSIQCVTINQFGGQNESVK